MIDIIIPTLMKCPKECLEYSITEALSNDLVKNIFIIDNTGYEFKQNIKILSDRLHVVEMQENIYVNPSWNLGMSLTECDNIIIMNDDLYVHKKIYNYVYELMQSSDIGLCSVETSVLSDLKEYLVLVNNFSDILTLNEIFGFEPNTYNISGWFFCIRKQLWKNIPEQIKILYGDMLIYDRIRSLNYKVKNISNIKIGHINHATAYRKLNYISNRSEIVKQDKKEYFLNKKEYNL
jgi:hypothetical protein